VVPAAAPAAAAAPRVLLSRETAGSYLERLREYSELREKIPNDENYTLQIGLHDNSIAKIRASATMPQVIKGLALSKATGEKEAVRLYYARIKVLEADFDAAVFNTSTDDEDELVRYIKAYDYIAYQKKYTELFTSKRSSLFAFSPPLPFTGKIGSYAMFTISSGMYKTRRLSLLPNTVGYVEAINGDDVKLYVIDDKGNHYSGVMVLKNHLKSVSSHVVVFGNNVKIKDDFKVSYPKLKGKQNVIDRRDKNVPPFVVLQMPNGGKLEILSVCLENFTSGGTRSLRKRTNKTHKRK